MLPGLEVPVCPLATIGGRPYITHVTRGHLGDLIDPGRRANIAQMERRVAELLGVWTISISLLGACATSRSAHNPDPSWRQVSQLVGESRTGDDDAFAEVLAAWTAAEVGPETIDRVSHALSRGQSFQSSDPYQRIARALEAWHEKGAHMPRGRCMQALKNFVGLFQSARIALASSEHSFDAPTVRAVLALSKRLRGRGTLLHAIMGFSLLEDVIEWSSARGLQPASTLTGHRAMDRELALVVAREHVCLTEDVEHNVKTDANPIATTEQLDAARHVFAQKILTFAQEPITFANMMKHGDFRPTSASQNPLLEVLGFDARPHLERVKKIDQKLVAYLRDGPQPKEAKR